MTNLIVICKLDQPSEHTQKDSGYLIEMILFKLTKSVVLNTSFAVQKHEINKSGVQLYFLKFCLHSPLRKVMVKGHFSNIPVCLYTAYLLQNICVFCKDVSLLRHLLIGLINS